MIQMEARAVDIVRQTKNTQPLNNCNIILFDASGGVYGMVTEGTDFTWLEGKPYFSKLASSRSIIWEGGSTGIGKKQ